MSLAGAAPAASFEMYMQPSGGSVVVAIPVAISGLRDSPRARVDHVALELEGRGGIRYKAQQPSASEPFRKISFEAYLWPYRQIPGWQVLRMDRGVYDRLKSGTVKIKGVAVVDFHRDGEPGWLSFRQRGPIPGVGICSSGMAEERFGQEMLKVECESPAEIPLFTQVKLVGRHSAREWNQRLGDAMSSVPYPRVTWLSPMNRRDTFFHLTLGDASQGDGSKWLVPRDVAEGATLGISAELPDGCRVVHYELSGIALDKFVVPAGR
jgi:hypothetical protein